MKLIIEFPKCRWCGVGGVADIRVCRSCKQFTCNDCVEYNSSDRCTHYRRVEVKGDGWNTDDET